jgi:protein SCO1/2
MSLHFPRFPGRLLVAVAMFPLLVSCEKQEPQQQVLIGKFREVGDFTFIDQQARPLEAESLKGKVWIANFIFTSCAAECLVLSARFAELQRLFAKEDDLAFVSFSVDPQTDTPERLGQFANRWHADPEKWFFLTGEAAEVDALVKNSFLLPITRDPIEAGKLMSERFIHSNRFAIVDRSGTVRAYVEGLEPEAISTISRIVVELLNESPETKPDTP